MEMTKADFEDEAWARGYLFSILAVILVVASIISSCQMERRSPEEIAEIDSMVVELAAAPATTVVRFKNKDLDIIEKSDEEWVYFILHNGKDDNFRTGPTRYLATVIEEVFPPDHPCHTVMTLNAVDKLMYRGMIGSIPSTEGERKCPQGSDE